MLAVKAPWKALPLGGGASRDKVSGTLSIKGMLFVPTDSAPAGKANSMSQCAVHISQCAVHISGPAPEKTVEQAKEKAAERVKERASGAKNEAQQQSSSGKEAVGAAAETASSVPLRPYPKVADTTHSAPNNGVKRPATVSASTQTDAVKAPKRNGGSESASWDPGGAAQAEWDEADQNSKPGLLGALLRSSFVHL